MTRCICFGPIHTSLSLNLPVVWKRLIATSPAWGSRACARSRGPISKGAGQSSDTLAQGGEASVHFAVSYNLVTE